MNRTPDVEPEGIYIFLGPTGYYLRGAAALQGHIILPPAERGDLARLVKGGSDRPATAVIVDGRYGDVLAVGHHEILGAISSGWQIWGVASMGAIRAAELDTYGMHGWGRAYICLKSGAPDDAVAVLHGPAPDYMPMTESLIDLRSFLTHLQCRGILSPDQVAGAGDTLANQWFGDRTVAAMLSAVERVAGATAAQFANRELPRLPQLRVKSDDLYQFLRRKPWVAQ